jgi:hypothetical protein
MRHANAAVTIKRVQQRRRLGDNDDVLILILEVNRPCRSIPGGGIVASAEGRQECAFCVLMWLLLKGRGKNEEDGGSSSSLEDRPKESRFFLISLAMTIFPWWHCPSRSEEPSPSSDKKKEYGRSSTDDDDEQAASCDGSIILFTPSLSSFAYATETKCEWATGFLLR